MRDSTLWLWINNKLFVPQMGFPQVCRVPEWAQRSPAGTPCSNPPGLHLEPSLPSSCMLVLYLMFWLREHSIHRECLKTIVPVRTQAGVLEKRGLDSIAQHDSNNKCGCIHPNTELGSTQLMRGHCGIWALDGFGYHGRPHTRKYVPAYGWSPRQEK